MTKKKTSYLLLVVVLLVWGRVVYNFLDITSDSSSTAASIPVLDVQTGSSILDESFELNLNYKDPFLKKATGRSSPKISNPNVKLHSYLKSPGEKEEVLWPRLNFKGRIQNKESTQELVVLEINGKTHLLSLADDINGLSMKKVIGDSLYCNFMGNDTLLVRNPFAK